MTFTESIKTYAHSLGFQLAGVTTPESPLHYPVYESWIAQGRHAGMGYLARESALVKRADPRAVFPECRSILVLGMAYPGIQFDKPPANLQLHGRIASYARGVDYHDVISERLQSLCSHIADITEQTAPYRFYTDTGPILERDLAQRAGLGWIGKNTCLINPALGSYFFLAEILLSIELDADLPWQSDACGHCTRCIQACPTGCILPDRTIDASRCISYLTIEHRGTIPPDLCAPIQNWVFGCDICQIVCPWNHHAYKNYTAWPYESIFQSKPSLPFPRLADEVILNNTDFKKRFEDSPVLRTKRTGYLRNVLIAIGNSKQGLFLPQIREILDNEDDDILRHHASWALKEIEA